MPKSKGNHRYHRQELIPDWDQQKLKDAKILILGAGATGSFVSVNMVLSGVGSIILVDYDTIEVSNLNRQLLFHDDDVGKYKADVAVERLKTFNPDIEIIAFNQAMEKLPRELIEDVTVVVSCLDNFPGRRWANSLALDLKVPFVTGGMFAFLGNVQTIIPYETPCFECQPLISQEKLAQACTPLGKTRKEIQHEEKETPLPSVSTLSSIIGGLMSQEVLKQVLGIGKRVSNYLFYDGLSNAFTELELAKNPNCPICGENFKLKTVDAIVLNGELVEAFRYRIAFSFGLKDPKIMHKGKYLKDTAKMDILQDETIYVLDDNLASPISLIIKHTQN